MQTKKKGSVRNVSEEPTSPRVSRSRKKSSENAQLAEKKVPDLMTSSARRQRGGSLQIKNDIHVPAKGSNRGHPLVRDENADVCPNNDGVTDTSLDHKCCEELADCPERTIFSPKFHSTTLIEGRGALPVRCHETDHTNYHHRGIDQSQTDTQDDQHTAELMFVEEKQCIDHRPTSKDRIVTSSDDVDEDMSPKTSDTSFRDMVFNSESDALDADCDMEVDGMRLSSEVSAIYFAMKNSKLECVDEHEQETVAANVYVEDAEYDDFDPYFFIKNLPELSSVVPTFRPVLLPKQTRSCPSTSLVLDLDETLVHSTLEPCDDADFTFPVTFNLQEYTVYVRCRPHLRDFMEGVAGLFEIIIFTASQSIYAEQLLNVLDPKRKIFRHRVYRDSCVYVEGNYLKDLSVLGRDLARVIIIDNSPQAFGFQVDNGIPIESWFDDRTDEELLRLLPFLETLVGVNDVRPLIAKKYNLREKIAAAVYPPSNPRIRNLLER